MEWSLDADISLSDRDEILRLARQTGIVQPARVFVVRTVPGNGRLVVVQSREDVRGNRRRRDVVTMWRDDWVNRNAPRSVSMEDVRVGRWVANGKAELGEAWRVWDDAWSVDISLGPGVTYDDAEAIVRAKPW